VLIRRSYQSAVPTVCLW